MPAGRPPKPIEQKMLLAKGDGRDPSGARVAYLAAHSAPVQRTGTVPEVSVPLGAKGAEMWQKLWSAGWWLHPAEDFTWLEQICQSYDAIEAFNAIIAAEGMTATGSMGQLIAHPLLAERNKAFQIIQKCLSQLGFSPTDRARLSLTEAQTMSIAQQMSKESRVGQPAARTYSRESSGEIEW